ncbi:hypothetical protein [Agrobacterium tumefaciens]|uniref:hypothetical protein n=1 Tax=Agrobacterium tumefaciens TaxID=358 RepID=UPI001050D8D7|nr:hypothetical protein [Agrobacterium tumefaciens]
MYHYQGLVTGILAGLAAFFTIRQMQITDAKSEERHLELVELQTRRDALIVERLLVPNYRKLADYLRTLREVECAQIENIDEGLDEEKANTAKEMESIASGIQGIFEQSSLKEAYELFDGRLKFELESLQAEAYKLLVHASRAAQEPSIKHRFGDIRGDKQVEEAKLKIRRDRAGGWNQSIPYRAAVMRLLEGVLASFDKMRRTYRLKDVVLLAE